MKEDKRILEYRNDILKKIEMNEKVEDFVFSINDIEIGILEMSVYLEDEQIIRKLLEIGIDPNGKKGLDEISPLSIAVAIENKDIVDLLIKYRANVNQSDELGITPIITATKNNNIDIIKSLVIAGANIYKSDFYGQSAISIVGAGDNHEIFDFFTRIMLKNDDFKDYYDNILFSAIASKNMTFVKKFAELNEIKDIYNNQGKTPLHIAVENDYLEVIPFLLSKGVSINHPDKNGSFTYDLSYQCQYLNEKRQNVINRLIENYVPLKHRIGAIKSTITSLPQNDNNITNSFSKRKLH